MPRGEHTRRAAATDGPGRRRGAGAVPRPDGGLRRQHRRRRSAQYSIERRLQLRLGARAAPAADQNRDPRAGVASSQPGVHLHDQLLRPQRTADRRPERSPDPRPPAAAGVVPAGARRGGRRRTSASRPTTASRCCPGGRARSRTPAPPKAARTWSSTSTTRRSRTLRATGGWVLTLHEFLIGGDDAWVTANKNMPKDLSKYGGAYNGALIDSAVQEYNLKTGKLLFNWDALQHIPLGESMRLAADQRLPLGRLPRQLDRAVRHGNVPGVDARHLGRLPGQHPRPARSTGRSAAATRASRFGRGARLPVAARRAPADRAPTVTMFDDHCCQLTGGGTYVGADRRRRAGLVLQARPADAHAPRCWRSTAADDGLDADYMGDTQPLPNGNVFVGWGSSRTSPSTAARARCCSTRDCPGPTSATARTVEPVGRPAADPARGRGAAHGRHDDGVRELERRDAGHLLARAGAATAGGQLKVLVSSPAEVRLRDRDARCPRATGLRGPGAGRRRPRDRDLGRLRLSPCPASPQAGAGDGPSSPPSPPG